MMRVHATYLLHEALLLSKEWLVSADTDTQLVRQRRYWWD
jgi:hypothetical protein